MKSPAQIGKLFEGKNLFTVKEAAEYLGFAANSLRIWDTKGVLVPQRTAGNQRRYSREQLDGFTRKGYERIEEKSQPVIPEINSGQALNSLASRSGFQDLYLYRSRNKFGMTKENFLSHLSKAAVITVGSLVIAGGVITFLTGTSTSEESWLRKLPQKFAQLLHLRGVPQAQHHLGGVNAPNSQLPTKEAVLAEQTVQPSYIFRVRIPSTFDDTVTFKKGLEVAGVATFKDNIILGDKKLEAKTINALELTAGNILYSLKAGDGITVSSGQNPTIANSGVLSVGGKTGAVTLTAGTGITIDGTKITNSLPEANQNLWKTFTVGSTSLNAGSTTDTFTFASGNSSELSLAIDSTNKKLTLTPSTGFTDSGTSIYLTTSTDSVGIGTTAPSSKLEVAGTSWLRGSSSTTGLSVDSSGNVGIGTTTPSSFILQMAGAIGPTTANSYDLGSAELPFRYVYAQNLVSGSSGTVGLLQRAAGTIAPANITDDLVLGATATSSATVKLTGTTNAHSWFNLGTGNVGIGTTTPNYKLEVAGNLGATGTTTLGDATEDSISIYGYLIAGNDTLGNAIEPKYGSKYDFGSSTRPWANVYADNITTSGNVSMSGTTQADFRINQDYAGDDGESSTLTFERGSPAVNAALKWNASNVSPSYLFSFNAPLLINPDSGISYSGTAALIVNQIQNQDIFTASASGTPKFVINNSGNVGIGTTAPVSKLDITDTSNTASSLGITNNTATTIGAGVNTLGVVDISSTSLTTGNLVNLETTTALTSGRMLNITSTSTALTSGNLLRLDWTPGSATTATGDMFSLNIGANGTTTGNLFNILDSSSSIFSISETTVTTSLPTNFTSSGDVSIAYDINMTNPTASYIKSGAPLYIQAGKVFNSSDLVLKTFNRGSIVLSQENTVASAATSYGVILDSQLIDNAVSPTTHYSLYNVPTVNITGDTLTTLYTDYIGLTNAAGTVTTWYGTYIAAPTGSGTTSNKYALVVENAAGNIGLGVTDPGYRLELYDATNSPAFALSDDDIAHGVTTVAQTDTFFHLSSISTTVGGAYLQGIADATGVALQFRGIQSSDPTDTTPAISLIGAKASGTGVVDLGAAETVFQVANNDDAAALTILGNGNVGIGTTEPPHRLTIDNTVDDGSKANIRIRSLTTRYRSDWYMIGATGMRLNAYDDTAAVDLPIQIDASKTILGMQGNVGINATSPLAALDVRGNLGTVPAASISATTSFAALVVDNSGAGDLFTASSSGLNRFVITQNGNVGIGTTTPSAPLHVKNTAADTDVLRLDTSATGIDQQVDIRVGSANAKGIRIIADESTLATQPVGASIQFYRNTSTTYPGQVSIDSGAHDSAALIFRTAPASTNITERMRITSSGNVGINATSPLAALDVRGNLGTVPAASVSANTSFATLIVDNTGVGDLITASTSGTTRFTVANNGNLTVVGSATTCTIGNGTGATNCTSDIRLKDNIVSLDGSTLSKIMTLNPVSFTWKNNKGLGTRTGLIAQEVKEVFPEFVNELPNGYLGLDYAGLISPAIKAIQEQQWILRQVQNDNLILASQGEALQGQVASLSAALLSPTSSSLRASETSAAISDGIASSSATSRNDDFNNLAIEQFSNRITLLETNLASFSAILASGNQRLASSSALLSSEEFAKRLNLPEGSTLETATVSGTLTVLGRTTLNDVGITGAFTAGLLSINGMTDTGDAEINTLGGTLKLQTLAFDNIEMMAGKVTIDTSGNITTTGTITASEYRAAAGKSTGGGVIKAGTKSIDVLSPIATASSRIFVTANTSTTQTLSVISKIQGRFTISVQSPVIADLPFDWWIINEVKED